MRTTIAVDDILLDTAKRRSLEAHVSLASFIESALRDKLAASEIAEGEPEYRPIRTFKGKGLLPGVDLLDSRALGDAMDEIG
jgi:hypothetical protein